MSDVKKEIGERLKATRERKGLKQNRVALYLGVHNSTLAKYESGEREPDNETLMRLAEYYEIKVEWILSGEPNSSKTKKDTNFEAYKRLSQDDKKIVDDMIKALEKRRER